MRIKWTRPPSQKMCATCIAAFLSASSNCMSWMCSQKGFAGAPCVRMKLAMLASVLRVARKQHSEAGARKRFTGAGAGAGVGAWCAWHCRASQGAQSQSQPCVRAHRGSDELGIFDEVAVALASSHGKGLAIATSTTPSPCQTVAPHHELCKVSDVETFPVRGNVFHTCLTCLFTMVSPLRRFK